MDLLRTDLSRMESIPYELIQLIDNFLTSPKDKLRFGLSCKRMWKYVDKISINYLSRMHLIHSEIRLIKYKYGNEKFYDYHNLSYSIRKYKGRIVVCRTYYTISINNYHTLVILNNLGMKIMEKLRYRKYTSGSLECRSIFLCDLIGISDLLELYEKN